MRNKKVVRLTENQLHNIIAESVKKILKESKFDSYAYELWGYEFGGGYSGRETKEGYTYQGHLSDNKITYTLNSNDDEVYNLSIDIDSQEPLTANVNHEPANIQEVLPYFQRYYPKFEESIQFAKDLEGKMWDRQGRCYDLINKKPCPELNYNPN